MTHKRIVHARYPAHRLRLAEIDLHDLLSLGSGWRPPEGEFERSRTRWGDWDEFVADYQQLRAEFMASGWGRSRGGVLPFAERLYLAIQAGQDPREVRG